MENLTEKSETTAEQQNGQFKHFVEGRNVYSLMKLDIRSRRRTTKII